MEQGRYADVIFNLILVACIPFIAPAALLRNAENQWKKRNLGGQKTAEAYMLMTYGAFLVAHLRLGGLFCTLTVFQRDIFCAQGLTHREVHLCPCISIYSLEYTSFDQVRRINFKDERYQSNQLPTLRFKVVTLTNHDQAMHLQLSDKFECPDIFSKMPSLATDFFFGSEPCRFLCFFPHTVMLSVELFSVQCFGKLLFVSHFHGKDYLLLLHEHSRRPPRYIYFYDHWKTLRWARKFYFSSDEAALTKELWIWAAYT